MKRRRGDPSQMSTKTNRVQGDGEEREAEESSSSDEDVFHHVGNRCVDPVHAYVRINDKQLTLEVDTGAALSII